MPLWFLRRNMALLPCCCEHPRQGIEGCLVRRRQGASRKAVGRQGCPRLCQNGLQYTRPCTAASTGMPVLISVQDVLAVWVMVRELDIWFPWCILCSMHVVMCNIAEILVWVDYPRSSCILRQPEDVFSHVHVRSAHITCCTLVCWRSCRAVNSSPTCSNTCNTIT